MAYKKNRSLASRAIDKLDDTLAYFKDLIKNGTPFDSASQNHRPISVTIAPTKGTKVLEANRKYADKQLENGYREDITPLYMIPWPEHEKMVAMDIKGEEWSRYSRPMTPDEKLQHGKPILSAAESARKILKDGGIEVTKVEGNVVHMTIDDRKKKNKSKDELDEMY